MVNIYDDIQFWYSEKIKPQEREQQGLQDLAKFLIEYLKQVDNLLQLIHACRSGDWEGYLAAMENLIKCFFAHDLLNYARLMPVHLLQMNPLEHEDPYDMGDMKVREFCCSELRDPFHEVVHRSDARAGDQSIKASWRYGRVKSRRSRH